MDIIVLNYIKKVENECNNVQLGKKWVCGLQIDAELKHLMRNGSISGLYNRIKFLAESSSAGKHRDMNNSVVKLTLVDELPKLKRSRQVVFCRILSFVSKRVTNECRDGPILDLLCGCIIDSGVKELYYDDYYLVYRLLKIGGNAGKTCLVLKLGTYTYTNEECDFESLKTEMSFIHYCQRINMTKLEDSYRLSALMFPNRGLRKH
ncbi:hypothetical protein BEWA_010920 [Theileria equi strain WA]|uniref:Uncharacterized protein n=1 Tax=Theileria equi strain WA TaxID=1537102 RepID=L0B1G9_THEEQ|nr:hypothetical protein BEWA_010920 [Theileria equi strain WA]AFZ81675.1 hypothetical protein BEWA_010920 [Theileria equi strain WA]|eukprot:XP_004831341.1 hypothetical protein BEWA_010920 [Theileria equi strain WA]